MDTAKILKGKRLLIVDDEKDVLDTLIELLDMCKSYVIFLHNTMQYALKTTMVLP